MDIVPQTQCCTKCKETKHIDEFSLKSLRTLKRQSWCKQCVEEYNRVYHARVKQGILSPREKIPSKRCTLCKQFKSLNQFSPHPLAQDGLHSLCDTCLYLPSSELAVSCKKCTSCQEWLPFKYFYNHRASRDGLTWWCKQCHVIRQRPNRHPDKQRDQNLVHKYGITQEEYLRILHDQGSVCASCGKPETHLSRTGQISPLVVDHDHVTGQIRALLCNECNTAYGLLREDEKRIMDLLVYHKRFQKS